jgi:hypothetical protein
VDGHDNDNLHFQNLIPKLCVEMVVFDFHWAKSSQLESNHHVWVLRFQRTPVTLRSFEQPDESDASSDDED